MTAEGRPDPTGEGSSCSPRAWWTRCPTSYRRLTCSPGSRGAGRKVAGARERAQRHTTRGRQAPKGEWNTLNFGEVEPHETVPSQENAWIFS